MTDRTVARPPAAEEPEWALSTVEAACGGRSTTSTVGPCAREHRHR